MSARSLPPHQVWSDEDDEGPGSFSCAKFDLSDPFLVPLARIVEALRSKLDEAGWEDRVRDLARGERPTFSLDLSPNL